MKIYFLHPKHLKSDEIGNIIGKSLKKFIGLESIGMGQKLKSRKCLLVMLLLCGVLSNGMIAKADTTINAQPETNATTQAPTTTTTTENTTENETIVQGWDRNKTSYYENGQKVIGVKLIGEDLYYFNTNGKLYTKKGLRTFGNNTYYFTKEHTLATGVVKVKGKYYYFQKSNGTRYENTGLNKVEGKYYLFNSSYQLSSGWYRTSDNKRYYFDKTTFEALTGWKYVGKYKYFFNKKGQLLQDVRNKIGKKSSYMIKVNRTACCVTVYAKDGKKGYTIPVVAFICSTGKDTPTGTFKTGIKHRWQELFGPCWGQWTTQITGNILFHSVYYTKINDNKTLDVKAYNKLGTMASHGCIRLRAKDAKWIYDNCKRSTTVTIYNNKKNPGPFDKPKIQKLKANHTWDPTDPAFK